MRCSFSERPHGGGRIGRNQRPGQALKIDYTRYSGGSYSCEWAWAKNAARPALCPRACAKKAYSWVEHCDWISGLLTGNTRPETMARSRCVAGHKPCGTKSWGGLPSAEFFEAVDPLYNCFRGHLYTHTATADECVGRLSEEWARRLGLEAGIAVGVGAIDCHFGAVGAGIRPGTLVKVMGTRPGLISPSPRMTNPRQGRPRHLRTGRRFGPARFDRDLKPTIVRRHLRLVPPRTGMAAATVVPRAERPRRRDFNRLTEEGRNGFPSRRRTPLALDWHNGRRTPDLDPRMREQSRGSRWQPRHRLCSNRWSKRRAFGSRAINERFQTRRGLPSTR